MSLAEVLVELIKGLPSKMGGIRNQKQDPGRVSSSQTGVGAPRSPDSPSEGREHKHLISTSLHFWAKSETA